MNLKEHMMIMFFMGDGIQKDKRSKGDNMKSTKAAVYKRKQQILIRLEEKKKVLVEELAEELKVSTITIRRDLESFEKEGIVKRFYGGAELIQGALYDDPAKDVGNNLILQCKLAIAKRAADEVQNGDTIFLNSSSTALLMLEYLKGKRVLIITNNGRILEKNYDPLIEVVVTGGEINANKKSMVGDFALQMLRKIRASKCFLGVSGITELGEISTAILQETMINMSMMEQTNGKIYILADHRKIGSQNNFIIGNLEQIKQGCIITDSHASPSIISSLEAKQNIEIQCVKVNHNE